VRLVTRVAAALEHHFQGSAYQDDDDLVFAHPDTGKPLDRSKVRKRFVRVVCRAGLRKVRFHDLRHTFGTRMAAQGVPLRTLQEWLGHRDFKTTLIYADYQPSAQDAELAERAFDRGINPGINLRVTAPKSEHEKPLPKAESDNH
jgi:integrase